MPGIRGLCRAFPVKKRRHEPQKARHWPTNDNPARPLSATVSVQFLGTVTLAVVDQAMLITFTCRLGQQCTTPLNPRPAELQPQLDAPCLKNNPLILYREVGSAVGDA